MKRLNTNSITNELENSSFFPARAAQAKEDRPVKNPAPASPVVLEPTHVVPPQSTVSRPEEPAPKPVTTITSKPQGAGRRYVRRTFDLYDDQLAYLTRASLEERLAGGEGSMNAMVREAIDAFIEKRRKQ